MIDQNVKDSEVLTTSGSMPPELSKKELCGIELWLKSVDKWLKIFDLWKRESTLLQNLVTLSTTGQDEPLLELKTYSSRIEEIMSDIRSMEKKLLNFKQQIPVMRKNQLSYQNRYLDAKDYIKKLSEQYVKAKTHLLEELAMAYPIMIF